MMMVIVSGAAWNLVWILPALAIIGRAVFSRRREPVERIATVLSSTARVAEAVRATVAALRE